jgi:tryptophanyl-tRNA synthetase
LLTIYAACSNQTIEQIESKYAGQTYQTFKSDLAELVVQTLQPIQQRFNELRNSALVDEVLDQGAAKASDIAVKKIRKANQLMGVGRKR